MQGLIATLCEILNRTLRVQGFPEMSKYRRLDCRQFIQPVTTCPEQWVTFRSPAHNSLQRSPWTLPIQFLVISQALKHSVLNSKSLKHTQTLWYFVECTHVRHPAGGGAPRGDRGGGGQQQGAAHSVPSHQRGVRHAAHRPGGHAGRGHAGRYRGCARHPKQGSIQRLLG